MPLFIKDSFYLGYLELHSFCYAFHNPQSEFWLSLPLNWSSKQVVSRIEGSFEEISRVCRCEHDLKKKKKAQSKCPCLQEHFWVFLHYYQEKKKKVIIMQLNSSTCILRTCISLLSQLLCSQMTKISLEVQAIAIPRLSLTVQSALSLTRLMKTRSLIENRDLIFTFQGAVKVPETVIPSNVCITTRFLKLWGLFIV